jgi:hypothetical protein
MSVRVQRVSITASIFRTAFRFLVEAKPNNRGTVECRHQGYQLNVLWIGPLGIGPSQVLMCAKTTERVKEDKEDHATWVPSTGPVARVGARQTHWSPFKQY